MLDGFAGKEYAENVGIELNSKKDFYGLFSKTLSLAR